MKKQYIKKNKPLLILNFLLLTFAKYSFAATAGGYVLLEPFSGITTVAAGDAGFSSYLQTIFNVAIAITAAISVIMLIIGGLEYIFSSASEAAAKDAKDRLTNAILGLLIALSGYLILNTLNPNLLKLTLPPINDLPMPVTPTTPTP